MYKTLGQLDTSYKTQQQGEVTHSLQEIQTLEQKNQLIMSKKVCVIDVYASWCGPCQITGPLFEKLALKYKDQFCVFAKENVELKLSPNVTVIPTFQFYQNGRFHSVITGADMDMIEKRVVELINS